MEVIQKIPYLNPRSRPLIHALRTYYYCLLPFFIIVQKDIYFGILPVPFLTSDPVCGEL